MKTSISQIMSWLLFGLLSTGAHAQAVATKTKAPPAVTNNASSANASTPAKNVSAVSSTDVEIIKDHRYERSIQIADTKLQLNGVGVRYKFIIPVYTAALWTTNKVHNEKEFLEAPGPKRITLTLLRNINSNELGSMFIKGVQNNIERADFPKAASGIVRMGGIFSDVKTAGPGDTITIDWVPGKGATIYWRERQLGEPFAEPAFYRAMMGIWLGDKAVDNSLKAALLSAKAN